ncbi:LysM peptidoglycan-binding domain-containing protein [Cohnella massiliensis]|uniref:LysM peptidoglycan-binding domain-containing protein n=1 Tax=Cohnella massiliensis TaxID=1816691 RepID=UPI0009BA4AA0|nr:LysM peptidoglycan-binding domain-containing protein [Cohnella massiliensis]
MTESLNGLRFDIYERIQLSEDAASIDQLEEIELVPHMQALSQEDQVLLKGHLLLTGVYRSQEEPSALSQLEHWIPVEISLPLSRVQSQDELAVEIDNFDVDVLSIRSLNVTGVLSLRGLQVSAPQAPVWREDGFTVVHQAPVAARERQASPEAFGDVTPYRDRTYGESSEEISPFGGKDAYREQDSGPIGESWGQPQADDSADRDYGQAEAFAQPQNFYYSQSPPFEPSTTYDAGADKEYAAERRAGRENPNSPYAADARDEDAALYGAPDRFDFAGVKDGGSYREGFRTELQPEPEGEPEPVSGSKAKPEPSSEPISVSAAEPEPQHKPHAELQLQAELQAEPQAEPQANEPQAEPIALQPEVHPPQPREPKIALTAKSADSANAEPSYASGLGLLTQLGEKASKREPEPAASVSVPADEPSLSAKAPEAGDEIEWTRLFLSKGGEEQSFRKLKLCIVQREDTLEAIAVRYNVQPRELQLYNRLAEPHVVEGQVIHIP